MRRWDALSLVLGLAILAAIIALLGPARIWAVLVRVDLRYFLLATVAYFFSDCFGGFVLMTLLNDRGRLRFFEYLSTHMCGLLYSVPTPGRVGYYYAAHSLSRKLGTSITGNMGVLTFIQGIYLSLRAVSALIATVYFSLTLPIESYRTAFLLVSFFPLALVAFIVVSLFSELPHRLMGPVPLLNRLLVYVANMQVAARTISVKKTLTAVVVGFLGWLPLGLQWYFLAQSLDLGLSFLDCLMMYQLVTALLFVPLPSGLGVTEGGAGVVFSLLGLAAGEGVAFMLLVRANMVLVDAFGLRDVYATRKQG